MGAGVNHILENKTISKHIAITKIVDEKLVDSMWEYLLTVVLNVVTNHYKYINQQKQNIWNPIQVKSINNTTIGILGLGQLGSSQAIRFKNMGFKVKGYSSSQKQIEGIQTFTSLDDFCDDLDIVINLLPLTEQTKNILNKELFSKFTKQAYIINVGRGEHIVIDDLIQSLDTNILSGATLDVFESEPLDSSHPFWNHDKITITPHIASITNPTSVTKQIMVNHQRVSKNLEPFNKIDLNKGY